MKYKLVSHLPVAKFFYQGNHSHPVRRTVVITDQNDDSFTGYELREGNITRPMSKAPVKTYCRSKIAKTSSLRLDNPLRSRKKVTTTLVRKPLSELEKAGI